MTFVGAAGPLLPGESTPAVFEAEAGEYIALCFIPVGTTGEGPEGEGDGPPHFVEGQRSEFMVE